MENGPDALPCDRIHSYNNWYVQTFLNCIVLHILPIFRWSLYCYFSSSFIPTTVDNNKSRKIQNYILQNIFFDEFWYMVLCVVYVNSTIIWIWKICCGVIWINVSKIQKKIPSTLFSWVTFCSLPIFYRFLQMCSWLGIQWTHCLYKSFSIHGIFDTSVHHCL